MTFLIALALGIGLLLAPSPRLWAASPLGDYVTDYCGTYEAVGVTHPAEWLECRKEWERLKEAERLQLAIERRRSLEQAYQQAQERQRQAELEERRVRALEQAARAQEEAARAQREAAQAQREAAQAQEGISQEINRPLGFDCLIVGGHMICF
jgi:hypothetical protein